jgi:hypothetical protein
MAMINAERFGWILKYLSLVGMMLDTLTIQAVEVGCLQWDVMLQIKDLVLV